MHYKKIFWLPVVALLLIQCKGKPQETATKTVKETDSTAIVITQEQMSVNNIMLGEAIDKMLSGTIKVNGKLDVPPQNLVSISVPYGGLVKYTDLLQGTHVHKGETLATLENAEYIQLQQDYAEAMHQLDFLKSEYQRQKELQVDNINAGKTYQKAVADYETMKVRAEALKQKLLLLGISPAAVMKGTISRTVDIPAPINGYVTKVLINRGKYVQANDVLFELVDPTHTHCELSIFEKNIPQLHIGDKVTFRLANETQDREAEVHLIGKEIREDRTVQVHCHMTKEDEGLLPGSYITAEIHVQQIKGTALPSEAIIQQSGREFVYLLEAQNIEKKSAGKTDTNYHFRQIPVRTGMSSEGFTQVFLPENTPTNASFVTKGAYILFSKMNTEAEDEE
ncbi:efflux RND transporter periplasmic adaptor subunit [Taibaiella soli]|nr:efflux RND transporter periplasmic adaptor subunit [Taibaiella soli]